MDEQEIKTFPQLIKLLNARQVQITELLRGAIPTDALTMVALTTIGISTLLGGYNWSTTAVQALLKSIVENIRQGNYREVEMRGN